MSTFQELGLSEDALNAVEKLEYTEPTPVQEQAIPVVLEGKDIIAAASTGTGKTAAFLLPLLSKLEKVGKGKRAPRVLVITPTRELAQQITGTCIRIARSCGHYATTVYGGTPYVKQIKALKTGTDVLIATPGRLKDLMERNAVDLSRVEALVLDEADRMLDMGFLPDVKQIVEALPEKRQTLLFSATIDRSIRKNLESLLTDPVTIQIAKKGEVAKAVDHYIMPIKQKEKPDLLKALLDELGHDKVIVFARTKARVEEVAKMLDEAGFAVECIHSDRTQAERRSALGNFAKGRAGVIVATDVLARGIDVPAVDYVVNYDLPDMAEDYIHRIGRTGRAGVAGLALSFVSQNSIRPLESIENLIHMEIPVKHLETYDLDMGVLKKRHSKAATRKSKHKQHSDERAKRFKEAHYNYEGWGDKRNGKPKMNAQSDEQPKQRGKAAQAKANGNAKQHAKPHGKPHAKLKSFTGKEQPNRKKCGFANDEEPKKKFKRKNRAFKKGVSGKAKNAKKKAAREAKQNTAG